MKTFPHGKARVSSVGHPEAAQNCPLPELRVQRSSEQRAHLEQWDSGGEWIKAAGDHQTSAGLLLLGQPSLPMGSHP